MGVSRPVEEKEVTICKTFLMKDTDVPVGNKTMLMLMHMVQHNLNNFIHDP